MNRLAPVALLAALVAAPNAARSDEGQGFAELRASVFPGASGTAWQTVERVRPSFEHELTERWKLVATVEGGLTQGRRTEVELERILRQSGLGELVDAGLCCAPQHENETLRVSRASDYLDVDRLYLDLYAPAFDLRVGRQAIHWGSAQFFNPTDPFPEVLLAEPWRPRRGANAARATVPFGDRHDAAAVLAMNDALDELRAAGRVRLNVAGTDFALVGAWRGEDRALAGIDLRGTFGVGWWIEAAWFPAAGGHEEVAAGIDYSFPLLERATAFAQYYRNGAGQAEPTLPVFARRPEPFAPFVRGRDYGLIGATLGITPEVSGSLMALANLGDGSMLAVPTASWSLRDWLDLWLSAQLPFHLWGDGGELDPAEEDLQLEQDFGPPYGVVTVDLDGLVPAATITAWARASF
jgi:hypothetical protein